MEQLIIQPQDREFYAELVAWLDRAAQDAGGTKAAAYPVIFNADGSLNRGRTLELPCYLGISLLRR